MRATLLAVLLAGCSAAAPTAFDDGGAPSPPAPRRDAGDPAARDSGPAPYAPPDAGLPEWVGDPCPIGRQPSDLCWRIPAGCYAEHTPDLPADLYGRCTFTCTDIVGGAPGSEKRRCEDPRDAGGHGGRCMHRPLPDGGTSESLCVPLR